MADIVDQFKSVVAGSEGISDQQTKKCIAWLFQRAIETGEDVALNLDESSSLASTVVDGMWDTDIAAFAVEQNFSIQSANSLAVGGRVAWVLHGRHEHSASRINSAAHIVPDPDAIEAVQLPSLVAPE